MLRKKKVSKPWEPAPGIVQRKLKGIKNKLEPRLKSKIESGAQSVKVAKKKPAASKEVKEEPKARTFEEIAEEK